MENGINGSAPTDKQLNAIRKLARMTNTSVDMDSIRTKQEASKILDELIPKGNLKGKDNSSTKSGNDCREKKVAYGLAVKLVFARYQQLSMDTNAESFWSDVDEFYQQYLEHQDRAVKSGSQ